jgi:hypothetical protein
MGLFDNLKVWFLQNQTTLQILKGQFAPQNLSKNINPKWGAHTALSRSNEILQFLNQGADMLSFQITMRDRDAVIGNTEQDIKLLQSWAKPDPLYGNRPPVLTFWVGNGWETMDCVIDSLSNIQYKPSNILGALVEVTAQITLRQYSEFSLESKGLFETRYHRAVTRDYYELLAWREYKSPILGDIIRKDHPGKPNIRVGDIIRLPSVEAVRKKKVSPTSIVLSGAYGKKMTDTKSRRLEMLDLRSNDYVSHILIG